MASSVLQGSDGNFLDDSLKASEYRRICVIFFFWNTLCAHWNDFSAYVISICACIYLLTWRFMLSSSVHLSAKWILFTPTGGCIPLGEWVISYIPPTVYIYIYGGFLKWGYLQIIGIFPYKPTILGIPHLWKPPYMYIYILLWNILTSNRGWNSWSYFLKHLRFVGCTQWCTGPTGLCKAYDVRRHPYQYLMESNINHCSSCFILSQWQLAGGFKPSEK